LKISLNAVLTLLLLLLAFFLLAQTINQRSVLYGIALVAVVALLIKVITKYSAIFSILFLISVWLLIQSPPVQTWLISKATSTLSRELNTTISIKHVDLSLFNKIIMRKTLIEDQNKDTLLYAGELNINITDWFFAKDSAELHYIGLNDATIKLQRTDSVWNYQFLADYFAGPKKTSTKKGIVFELKKIQFNNIHFLKRDGWRGEDMNLHLASMSLNADEINFSKKKARISSLEFTEPSFSITNYQGKRLVAPVDTAKIINDKNHLRFNAAGWDITAKSLNIKNGSFRDDKLNGIKPTDYFDSHHIYFSSINWDFTNLKMQQDTVTAQIQLSTKERSGLVVKKLTSQVKFFPEAMEFYKLDLQTGKSHLRKFFAMRYKTFDDMSDFINKVTMEGDFTDANIDSDDIGYFAPELKNWKKNIRITGNISGPVENLRGKNIQISAGKNTLLNGDIHLKGLPDIDQTFIEFKSNDFRTTYADMVTLVPQLKEITQPRLDLIEYLRFKGTFNGYIKNFVTNGTIETKLGTLITDVNMKFPDNSPTIYAGSINTTNFDLGKFLDNDNLGAISFDGKINGSGLAAKTLNAELDGTVHNLEFNDYTYQDIVVKGSIAKKKFNGQLISSDPNLQAELNGLIDFSHGLPKFDFDAQVTQADFKKLNFIKDPLEFNGKLQFNFTGNNLDNILGTARIYDAAIFKNGQRISFDSLTLNSSVSDNNDKTITILSNEFTAVLAGEFSTRDLPAAFQTFLNKYYPSYIQPTKTKLAPQNFSFVISTKKVDNYLDLFEKKITGFNNTTISGRINTKENLLDLNAEIPQFTYKNISFNNVNLKGIGNLDSLSAETTIGDVQVNDSLHFPGTHIKVHSSSDVSDVTITTSANQTLNSANIAAQVKTLPDGVRIKFKPSVFEVNSKPWTINKDGELVLSKNLVSANDLKIYSGDQQVLITTHPSKDGSWNDVHIDLKKINIGDFTPYLVKSDRLEGLLTGTSDITDPFGTNQNFTFNGQAEQFRLNNDSVGKLDIAGNYDKTSGLVNAQVNSDNKNYHFDLKGIFSTLDSTKTANQPINLTINLKDTKINLLQKYLDEIFSNIDGYASGQLQIAGAGNKLKYLGKLQLKDGRLKVNYTQCSYKIPLANVDMEDGFIDFGPFEIQDTLGHTGQVTRAKLYHHSFNDLSYDFAISTNKMLLLNTKLTDNNQFYGKLIGRVAFTLTGKQENMQMGIKGEPTDSSNIYIPSSTNRESADADFIVWKVYGKEMQAVRDKKATNLTVKLDITANNYANVYVVIDPLTNDIIKANGRGNLLIRVGTSEDLTINGRYEIDKGSYNFSFQSYIHKPFTFSEDADNFIQWTGDPYDAHINIEAKYEAENISFNDLGYSSLSSGGYGISSNSPVKKYRGPILVTAKLTDRLMKPTIAFEIDLPPNSPLRNDQDALTLMQIIQKDPNELNKQVSFLVVFDQFGPLSNSNTTFDPTTAISGIFVNSISGIFSNAMSRWTSQRVQKIFNDPSIRVNFNSIFYNGSNQLVDADPTRLAYDRTNLNLTIGKSFLNERLTFIFGSALDFGLSAQQAAAASFQFLPDITAEYKITPDGRFAFSLFYRDSYQYLSVANHTENSSGGSISYTRDFDKIDELFKKKKKEKPKAVKPPVPAQTQAPAETSSN
jgi:hypothetical protein